MSSTIHKQRILKWSNEDEGETYVLNNNLLEYLGEHLFFDFEPGIGPHADFFNRLENWLNNVVDEEDQKLLFRLATKIFYVGREEFNSLHRTSFNSTIKRWLIDQIGLTFDIPNFNDRLAEAITKTWYCPITDSFRINQFYHINHITSKHTFRPDWRSLKKFGSEDKIREYLKVEDVKYIVLLEDFVGTGSQVIPSLKFACEIDENIRVLFVPMILCPVGQEEIVKKLSPYTNFTLSPIILLNNGDLISEKALASFPEIKPYTSLIEKLDFRVRSNISEKDYKKILPYGYGNTGGLTVMFTNTPNNSLPLIYLESDAWNVLFKRHFRD